VKETFLAIMLNPVNQPKTATVKENFFGQFFSSASLPPAELLFRGLRVVAVVFAIVFINVLLIGAMKYMVASGRDETVSECRQKIVFGGAGTVLMFFLYYLASIALVKIESGG